jgi:hypothetical protein
MQSEKDISRRQREMQDEARVLEMQTAAIDRACREFAPNDVGNYKRGPKRKARRGPLSMRLLAMADALHRRRLLRKAS